MVRIVCLSLVWLLPCANGLAELAPARPKSVIIKPAAPQITATAPLQSSGRTTVYLQRDRLGVTSGTSSQAFRTNPMHRRPDNFVTQTRKWDDGTVATDLDRVGITRSASSGNLGVSPFTRGIAPAYRNGLSSPNSYGRSWSGFKRVK